MSQKVIVLTSGTTWTAPSDWNDASALIECIGAGGNGANGSTTLGSGGGGGGGKYAQITAPGVSPNQTVNINIPAGGVGTGATGTWFKSSALILANNGGNGSNVAGGAGGSGGVGTILRGGGAGGNGGTPSASGGGGGGAGGPTSIGGSGGNGSGHTGAGGGGGADSGFNGSTSGGNDGGDGGSGPMGGAGLGAIRSPSPNGGNGTGGGGGGGAFASNDGDGGGGGQYLVWTDNSGGPNNAQSFGPGGGGGGGGPLTGNGGVSVGYGAGGGGGGTSSVGPRGLGGSGTQGIIVITYTPILFALATETAVTADTASASVNGVVSAAETAVTSDAASGGTGVITASAVDSAQSNDQATAAIVSGRAPPIPPHVSVPVFDWFQTVISQYANSPILLQLIEDFFDYIDPTANLDAFYNLIWNVDTAQGYGLDVWGRIVGVTRALNVATGTWFGFEEQAGTTDSFNAEPFYSGHNATTNFLLTDDAYRQLILAKALANISDGSIASINQMLINLFPGAGNCYVADTGGMGLTYIFNSALTPVQQAIITNSGVLPKPTGVSQAEFLVPAAYFEADFAHNFYQISGTPFTVNSYFTTQGIASGNGGQAATVDHQFVPFGGNQARITNNGLLNEEGRTNLFLNSGAPVTQTIALSSTGNYALTAWGPSGSVQIAAGTATGSGFGVVTASPDGSFLLVNITATGTVVVMVTGPVRWVNVEQANAGNNANGGSLAPIATGAASAVRGVDNNIFPLGGLALGIIVIEGVPAKVAGTSDQAMFGWDDNSVGNSMRIMRASSRQANFVVESGGVTQANLATGTLADNTRFTLAARFGASNFGLSVNKGTPVTGASGSVPTGMTLGRAGQYISGFHFWGYVRRIVIFADPTLDLQQIQNILG